jgi:hypothetical protein
MKLRLLANELEQRPPGSLVHSDMEVFYSSENGPERAMGSLWRAERRVPQHRETAFLALRSIVNGAAMMFDAELAQRFGPIPSQVSYHDQWFAALASCIGGAYPLDKRLVLYRQHGANVVGSSRFAGRFSLPGGGKVALSGKLIIQFVSRWFETKDLIEAVAALGLDVPRLNIPRLVWIALRYAWSDPVLARAAVGRAIGKLLSDYLVPSEAR